MADIPPPPPGFKLDAPSGQVPPPPPGFKLDVAESARPAQSLPASASGRALQETITGPSAAAGNTETLFNKQRGIEERLRAAGKNPETDPEWQQVSKDLSRSVSSGITGTAMWTAGMDLLPAGAMIKTGLSKSAGKIGELYSRSIGRTAKTAAETLREQEASRAAEAALGRQREAEAYQKKIGVIEKAQGELAKQPATAETRAHAQALRYGPFTEEQSRVLEEIRSRVRERERDYQLAGASTEQAKQLAAQHEAVIADAEAAVGKMEKEFLAMPQATPQQFGGSIRKIAEQIDKKYREIRETQSGYKEAIASSGNYERIDTRPIIAKIDEQLKGIRNPSLERALTHGKELLTSDGKPALTLRSADSLRGYLDSIIRSKSISTSTGPLAVDSETLHFVGEIRKQLVKAATDSWQPYKEALGRWRTFSRPLDIVERKGALKKSLDTDPLSTDYALTEAQVVGQVLTHARAGNPVFTRLVAESPELRNSARLYFTNDLFGKEAVPSVASLRTWLKANEGPLRQLGLYDEFRDIRVARETAARAVKDAKGASEMSAVQIREAEANERQVARELKQQVSLREKQKSRISEAEKKIAKPEDILAGSEKRASEASKRLESSKGEAQTGMTREEMISDRYRQFETQINVARPQEVAQQTRAFIKRLRDDKMIDDQKYGELLKDVQSVEDKYKDSSELRKRLLEVASGVVGAGTVYHFRNFLPF